MVDEVLGWWSEKISGDGGFVDGCVCYEEKGKEGRKEREAGGQVDVDVPPTGS